jgi:hypothetical protein
MPVGPMEPATKRGRSGVAYFCESSGGDVDLGGLFQQPPFAEAARRGLEGAGLHHVAADRQERLVDRLDDVGPGQDEVVVAPFERFATEVVGGQVVALDVRPHRAVVDEHPTCECLEVRRVERKLRDVGNWRHRYPRTKKARATGAGRAL